MLMWASIILIGIATFMVTSVIFIEEDEYKAQEKLEDGVNPTQELLKKQGIILRYSRPFFRRYVSPVVGTLKNKKKIKEKYKRKLAAAGLQDILSPEDFYAFKLFLILGFPIFFLGLRWFLEETWPLEYVFFLAPLGFIYPDLWIKGVIEKRQKEIVQAMPFAVDMLALSVEAGLDFMAAITKVVAKAKPSALTTELNILLKEIKIGASRAEALRNLAWRIDLTVISSFSATLIAADSVGASIGPILKALSAEIRQKRSSEVEKEGAKASTKILFPLMGFIVPAVFIVIASPLIIEAMMGGN